MKEFIKYIWKDFLLLLFGLILMVVGFCLLYMNLNLWDFEPILWYCLGIVCVIMGSSFAMRAFLKV